MRIIDVRHGLLRQGEHASIPWANGGAFVCICAQAGELYANDIPYSIQKNHIFHFGLARDITMSSSQGWLEYYIVFYKAEFPLFSHAETARLVKDGNPFSSSYGFFPSDPVFFANCFKEMRDRWISQSSLDRLRVRAVFYEMVHKVYSELSGNKASMIRPNVFEQAKQFLDKHYGETVSITVLADMLQVSSAHLNRLFKTHTGLSPRQYLMRLRLTAAEELLAASDMTLGEVAIACGFQDKYHLSHVFKNSFDLPPGAYRKINHRPSSVNDEPEAVGKNRVIISNFYRVTKYDSIPERIVCLSLPEAEICVALGLADKIVGIALAEGSVEDCRDEYKDRLSAIPLIPNDSPHGRLPAFETICKLQPDFVYGTAYGFRSGTGVGEPSDFERQGARVYASKGTYVLGCTLGDVYEDILNIGRIFDVEQRASEIVDAMQRMVAGLDEDLAGVKPLKVFVYDQSNREEAFTAGLSLESTVIRLAGGINVFESIPSHFATLSWSRVAEAKPDAILVHRFYSEEDAQAKTGCLLRRRELREVPAIRHKRIFSVRLSHMFPGIHNAEMVRWLASMLHPERVGNFSPSDDIRFPSL